MSVRCRFGDAVYETRIPEVHPEVVRRLLELQRVVEKKLGPVPEELFK